MSWSFFRRASMATTLTFNPTRINTTAPLQPHKPITPNFFSLSNLSKTPLFPSKISLTRRHNRPESLPESSLSVPEQVEFDEIEDDPTAELSYLDPETDPSSITEWELDFCSRPILDARGKKMWELVVCDASLSLQYTKYFPNNVINSITLKDAIVSISEQLGVSMPQKVRFFSVLSSISLNEDQDLLLQTLSPTGKLKLIHSASLHSVLFVIYCCFHHFQCLSLLLWLEERYKTIYTRHPGFQKGSKPLLVLDNPFPMDLPENLFGEKWAFVQLPFSAIQEEISSFETKFVFGASLDLDLLGIEIDNKTLIPGLAVASSRAKPLAAWMNGLEVCSIEADISRACLILSVGVSTRYTYVTYKKTPVTTSEAEAWEAAKKACGGLHFLAIQEDLDSDDCVGFWLLLDLPPPPV
ncbi:protein TAB2 homolog, chloroplastic [Carica papaya]|uniref:protein TAB2 homolog, chloroplastic n=1 Tax=Carica papaya TaxID=3649 RepID=UPI000B8CB300|nr:protein TAB2 homolog, chloroplastic [Carica papaya]